MPLLQVNKIGFSYKNGRRIFQDISFEMESGDVLSVIGPNGAGKSTLLNCLAGLCPVEAGMVLIDGQNLREIPAEQVARLVGYMQQNVSIVYEYSVKDVVLMGRAPYISTMKLPSSEDMRIAREAIENMHISHLSERPYTELSGGEKQQVMIARLLAQQPKLIIMDEPTSALDYGNQQKTIQMIRMLAQRGFSVIMTTHNPDHAVMLGGRVGAIDKTGCFRWGTADEILTDEFLSALYGIKIKTEYVPAFSRRICACVQHSLQ